METVFKQRIRFGGDLKELSKTLCKDFKFGNFLSCKIIPIGYEDFNFSLETTGGRFFVKVFAEVRTLYDCKRNVKIMAKALEAGVSLPRLRESEQGYLHLLKTGGKKLRICVMDFIDGKDLFSSKATVTKEDIKTIAGQAALINSIDIKPNKIYDSWAITSFPQEYEKKSKYLEPEDLKLIQPLLAEFQNLKIESLPHCFVHGDITRTNTIKDKNGKIWIVDFSVSNYYPRIQEMAVLACDILFDKDNPEGSRQNLKLALQEYQKTTQLTPRELEALSTYVKLAHAMHALCATYEKKVNKNDSEENEYFLGIGRAGLRL